MTHNEERLTDMPAYLRWFLIAFKQVGFPVIVCLYLGYLHFVEQEKNRNTQQDFKEVMMSLKTSIDYQTKILKRNHDE
jgi:hypothetical protein